MIEAGSVRAVLQDPLTERDYDLDGEISAALPPAASDAVLIRRLTRERLLARDRLADLPAVTAPGWTIATLPAAE